MPCRSCKSGENNSDGGGRARKHRGYLRRLTQPCLGLSRLRSVAVPPKSHRCGESGKEMDKRVEGEMRVLLRPLRCGVNFRREEEQTWTKTGLVFNSHMHPHKLAFYRLVILVQLIIVLRVNASERLAWILIWLYIGSKSGNPDSCCWF